MNRKERRAAEKASRKVSNDTSKNNIADKLPESTAGKVPAQTKAGSNNPDDVMHKLLDAKIEVPIGYLRQQHVFIATPCYGGQIGEPYFRSMMRLCILFNKYEIPYTVSTLANESLVTRG